MGALLMDLGRYREARTHLERALQISVGEFGIAHERNAGTLVVLGSAQRAQDDYLSAASSLRQALEVYENVSSRPPPSAISALTNMGVVLMEWLDQDGTLPAPKRAQILDGASGWLHVALDGCEQMYDEDYPVTGGILKRLV
jgi:tetratricopeptide (TPR) repeat protein